jgi:hypothetical protein
MNTVVAVDDRLAPVKNYLTQQGCQIIDIDTARHQQVDAVVLSGMEENLLGMQNIMVNAPVISAKGMTPEEIWQDIIQVIKLKQS